jgi:hypothetical protein
MKTSSKDSLVRLEREGKLKRQRTGADYLNDLLEAARRNFEAARVVRGRVDEASFKLYYDGLLQISRVVVLLSGYRPDGGEQHKTTFLAAGEILGAEYEDLIRKIQKFRIKRNDCVYDPKGLIGSAETEAIHRTAVDYWHRVRTYLQKENPQLTLFEDV